MNAETRAKELYDHFASLKEEDWASLTDKDFLALITQALRQAENDKLEEALAKISVGFWTCKESPFRHGASEAVWSGMKPDEMIEAIRSLIQKD
jgi:hypothetical protein